MIRSRFLQQAFESSDLEGAVVDQAPEMNPVEEEQLTQEINQDEQAIEECSVCLDETLNEQGSLVQQDVVAATVSEPKTEDVVQSEVALEAALIRMGTSRYREGYHSFPKSSLSFSKEEIGNTFTLAREGIKDFLIKIGKAIKELFRKIAMFFKKLFAKLRIKLGGYAKKLDKLNEVMKNLVSSDSTKDSGKADEVKKQLNELSLASVAFFVGEQNSSPYPVVNAAGLANDISGLYRECQSAVVQVKKEPSAFGKIVEALQNKFTDKLKKEELARQAKEGEAARASTNQASAITKGNINISTDFFAIGCAGKFFYGVIVNPAISTNGEIEDSTNGERTTALLSVQAEYIKEVENLDLGRLVSSFVDNYSKVKKSCDETSKIFKDIDTVHGQFEKLGDEISKPAGEEENASETAKACNGLVKNIKQLAVDLPSHLVKCHVHTIRDYLVIGNVIAKVCNSSQSK